MGIYYVSTKPQECKILAKLEKQTRFAVKDARLQPNNRVIAIKILADTRDNFLL
jgi:hypothetical protein